jgi:hypothetical protein
MSGHLGRRGPQDVETASLRARRYGGVEVQERTNLYTSEYIGETEAEDPRVPGEPKDVRGGCKPCAS